MRESQARYRLTEKGIAAMKRAQVNSNAKRRTVTMMSIRKPGEVLSRVDAGFNGNHNFVDCPEIGDVIHFVTSESITDEIDNVSIIDLYDLVREDLPNPSKLLGDIGENVLDAIKVFNGEAPRKKRTRGKGKKTLARSLEMASE
jgi:hypothetical protein